MSGAYGNLEDVLDRELPDARRRACAQRGDPSEGRRVVERRARVALVEMVCQVDRFRAQLDAVALREVERADERLIPLPEAGAAQHVERRVTERARCRLAE